MAMNYEKCDGCDKGCEFGVFTRTRDKAVYPTIGTKIIQKYNRNGMCIYITPGEVRDTKQAIKLAKEITQYRRHRIQGFVKEK